LAISFLKKKKPAWAALFFDYYLNYRGLSGTKMPPDVDGFVNGLDGWGLTCDFWAENEKEIYGGGNGLE